MIKVHDAIADDVGLVLTLAAFTDLEPNPERRPDTDSVTLPAVPRVAFGPIRRSLFKLRRGTRKFVSSPIDSTRRTSGTV